MPDCGPVRFSAYPVEGVVGVNWRLTRFVGEVPSARVCGLCRVVPYRILWLPCGHSMCQLCCSANSQDAERRCPLDQKQFDNFGSSVLTEDEAKTLKVHCWNEPHGCKFEGNMGNMLEHYEKQCTAHTVECLRCGMSVPHTEISTHYMAGCTAPASGVAGELFPSPESASLPLGDVNATDEELEALLREPMSEIQSQMKELMEHVSSQQSKLAEITRDVAAAEHNLKAEMDQVAARICSALSDQLRSQRMPAEEPGASAPGTLQETSEKMLILRKLEIFADMSLSTMENLRQQSLWQRDLGRVTALCEPQVRDCRYRHLTKARATLSRWSEGGEKVNYILTLKNCDERTMSPADQNVAQVTVPHSRDAYFTVRVLRRCANLHFCIAFCAMLGGSETSAPSLSVCAVRKRQYHTAAFVPMDEPSGCEEYGESLVHFHRAFYGSFDHLKDQGFIENGDLQFEIEFSYAKKVPPADTCTHPA